MSTQSNIAWYYVGVMALLLVGQNYVLNTAHKEQMAKLSAKLAGPAPVAAATPVSAGATPAQAAAAPAAAEPSKTVVAPPASTLNPTPAATTVPAHQATMAAAKAAPATNGKPASSQPLKASAAPAAKGSGKALPVEFGFRSEPFEKSKIVTLTNKSAKKLDCLVTVNRPGTGESQSFKVAVGASAEARLVGSEQGWKFKTGDRIEVAQAGFKTKSASVP